MCIPCVLCCLEPYPQLDVVQLRVMHLPPLRAQTEHFTPHLWLPRGREPDTATRPTPSAAAARLPALSHGMLPRLPSGPASGPGRRGGEVGSAGWGGMRRGWGGGGGEGSARDAKSRAIPARGPKASVPLTARPSESSGVTRVSAARPRAPRARIAPRPRGPERGPLLWAATLAEARRAFVSGRSRRPGRAGRPGPAGVGSLGWWGRG